MHDEAWNDLLDSLRREGGDRSEVEVKAAAGGLPDTVGQSLSALSNLPGGGWLILGLEEKAGFAPVGLDNPHALGQGIVAHARRCVPPVVVELSYREEEGSPVLVARVHETSPSLKPCRFAGHGWLRAGDGDFRMSTLEEQAFLASRDYPDQDRRPVAGATGGDLDSALVDSWVDTVRDRDPSGLGRFATEEMLFRGGIVDAGGLPTVAGLLALGVHPQQFYPRWVVNLAVWPGQDLSGTVRAIDPVTLSGPIPVMLAEAVAWARRTMSRRLVEDDSGRVSDTTEYPLIAFRELVANALVHRDLGSWSQGSAIEVRVTGDRLVVTNPGGLFGITADRLGVVGLTSARNGRLLELCRYVRTPDDARVVEALASGIPRVLSSLEAAGMPPPLFQDTGIRFTAVVRSRDSGPPDPRLGDSARRVLLAIKPGGSDVAELELSTGMRAPTIRKALRALNDRGITEQRGGRGRPTTYVRR